MANIPAALANLIINMTPHRALEGIC
jgi:hypothetical protein